MRMATFVRAQDPQAFDCSVVWLPGDAGGAEANIRRWLKQISLGMDAKAIAEFAATPEGRVYDFTRLDAAPDRDSLLAALIRIEGNTVVVKLKAKPAVIKTVKADFTALVNSILLR